MKRIIVCLFCLLPFLNLLAACGEDYSGWKKIEIPTTGCFYVPEAWVFTTDRNIMWFTDRPPTEENYRTYLFGIISRSEKAADDYVFPDIFPGYMSNESYGEVFSNSATLGGRYFTYEGQTVRIAGVQFWHTDVVWLYSMEDLVTEAELRKIAKSYAGESYTVKKSS